MECFLRWWKLMVRRVGEGRVRMNILIATGHDIINNNKSWGEVVIVQPAHSKRWKLFGFSFSWESLWWGGWKFYSFPAWKEWRFVVISWNGNFDFCWDLSFCVSSQHKLWPLVGHMFEPTVTRQIEDWGAAKYQIEFSSMFEKLFITLWVSILRFRRAKNNLRWRWKRQAKRNSNLKKKNPSFSSFIFLFHAYASLVQRQDGARLRLEMRKKVEVSEQIKNIESWWMLDVVSACCEKLSSKLLSRIAKLSHLSSEGFFL